MEVQKEQFESSQRRPLQMDCVQEYLEGQLHQVVALERSVRAGHGDDLGFLHQQVLGSIQSAPQQLEGPELLRMSEGNATG